MATELSEVHAQGQRILGEVERAVLGKREMLEGLLTAIFADGHMLIEDFPGLAKTLIAQSFATVLGLTFKRIQFTPDLLPGDITGGYVYDRKSGDFVLQQGPIFANVVLADEINRASPKTQAALLEAMQEGQVTLEGETKRLPEPFVVIATQNPIEYEGTFPLPEAQLDRFLLKLDVGYPSADAEQEMLKRRRERRTDAFQLRSVLGGDDLLALRAAIEDVHVDVDVERYIVELVGRTRTDSRVTVGASPRGSLALLKLSRAQAALEGRSFVLPDDVKAFAAPALAHRLVLEPDLWMVPNAADDVIQACLSNVTVPVVDAG
ncbi:MAG: AAA family ATPase [Candidatus Bipolaricaulia bacterium]